jgi:hypothetical protein
MEKVAEYGSLIVTEIANRDNQLTFQEAGSKMQRSRGGRFKVTLGIMPDYAGTEKRGFLSFQAIPTSPLVKIEKDSANSLRLPEGKKHRQMRSRERPATTALPQSPLVGILSETQLGDTVKEIFVSGDRLVLFSTGAAESEAETGSGGSGAMQKIAPMPRYYRSNPVTRVTVYDISDRKFLKKNSSGRTRFPRQPQADRREGDCGPGRGCGEGRFVCIGPCR